MTRLRLWLIRRLAGNLSLVGNVTIRGQFQVEMNQDGLCWNNVFVSELLGRGEGTAMFYFDKMLEKAATHASSHKETDDDRPSC